jgi:hypothetical protein
VRDANVSTVALVAAVPGVHRWQQLERRAAPLPTAAATGIALIAIVAAVVHLAVAVVGGRLSRHALP